MAEVAEESPHVASHQARIALFLAMRHFAEELRARGCPFTILYWDFFDRHALRFAGHPRLEQQLCNLEHHSPAMRQEIRAAARRRIWAC